MAAPRRGYPGGGGDDVAMGHGVFPSDQPGDSAPATWPASQRAAAAGPTLCGVVVGYLIITDSSTERTLCMHDATPGSWVVSRDGYRKQMAFFPYSLLTTLSTSIKSHENALLNFDTRVQDR